MDPKRFEECIFYLNTYGSYSGVVTFYVNHNHLKLACRFILEKVGILFYTANQTKIMIQSTCCSEKNDSLLLTQSVQQHSVSTNIKIETRQL